jgi:hypothetical protein
MRARQSKAMLLPLPRNEADSVGLPVHVALDAMRRGRGNASAAQTLCQVMILTGLLAEEGYGEATFEQMKSAENIISAAFDRGRDSDVWVLDEDGFAQFAVVVTTYESQIRRAPRALLAEVGDRLERFRAGESLDRLRRKDA